MCCFGFCTIRQWRWWVLKLLRFCEFCWMTLHKMLDQILWPFHRHENGGVRNDDDYSNKLKTNQHTTLLCVFFSCIFNPFSESIHFIANIEREKGVSRDKRERGTWKPSVVVMPSTRQVLMIKMLRAIWPFIQLQTVFPLPPNEATAFVVFMNRIQTDSNTCCSSINRYGFFEWLNATEQLCNRCQKHNVSYPRMRMELAE